MPRAKGKTSINRGSVEVGEVYWYLSHNNEQQSFTRPASLTSRTTSSFDQPKMDVESATNGMDKLPKASTGLTIDASGDLGVDESATTALMTPMVRPDGVPHMPLSEVSKHFDRNNKGFLDDTETALRRMDTQNLGYLSVHKVYSIMETLQKEQKHSAGLLKVLQHQQRKMINLKKGIIGLCIFAVILAVSNIGTSFAAVKLAKEVEVSSSTSDLTNTNGIRVGTTSKIINVSIQAVTPESSRRLAARGFVASACANTFNITADCHVAGELSYNDMVALHQSFCQDWMPGVAGCLGGGVDKVRLTCNGRTSTLFDMGLDEISPQIDPNYFNWTVFPAPRRSYAGEQFVNQGNQQGRRPCKQEFSVGMYCDTLDDNVKCLVLAAMDPDTVSCMPPDRFVKLCGSNDPFIEQDGVSGRGSRGS